jgi:hypothetical protein
VKKREGKKAKVQRAAFKKAAPFSIQLNPVVTPAVLTAFAAVFAAFTAVFAIAVMTCATVAGTDPVVAEIPVDPLRMTTLA